MMSYQQTVNTANRSNFVALPPPVISSEQVVSQSPGVSSQQQPLVLGVPPPPLMQAMIAPRLASRAPIIPQVPSVSTVPLYLQNKPSVAGFQDARTVGPSPPLKPACSMQAGAPSIPSEFLAVMNKSKTQRVISRRAIEARLRDGDQPMSATYRCSGTRDGQCQYIDQLRETDILCDQEGETNNHSGNKRYRQVIEDMKDIYKSTEDNVLKRYLSTAIVEYVYDYGGRFVKRDGRIDRYAYYYELTKSEARVKTSQLLRGIVWTTPPLHLQNTSVAGSQDVRTVGTPPPLNTACSMQAAIPPSKPSDAQRVISRRAIEARLRDGEQPMPATDSTMPGGKRHYIDQVLETDVVCGQGALINNHSGNKRYRQVIENLKVMCNSTWGKGPRTDLSTAIVEYVYNYGGRFVKRDEKMNRYYEVTKFEACVKTSRALSRRKKGK